MFSGQLKIRGFSFLYALSTGHYADSEPLHPQSLHDVKAVPFVLLRDGPLKPGIEQFLIDAAHKKVSQPIVLSLYTVFTLINALGRRHLFLRFHA